MKRAFITLSVTLISLSALAGDLRAMMQQPGEWELTMSGGGGLLPTTTQRGCYAAKTSVTDLANKNIKNCDQKSINIDSGMATVDAVCQLQGMKVTVHSIITPTGDAAFHGDSHVHLDGLPKIAGIPSEIVMSVDAHRTGPCQPGDKQM